MVSPTLPLFVVHLVLSNSVASLMKSVYDVWVEFNRPSEFQRRLLVDFEFCIQDPPECSRNFVKSCLYCTGKTSGE